MTTLLVVSTLIALVFAIGYFVSSDKQPPAMDTPQEVIEADLVEAGSLEAATAPEPTEQVKPKRTRKPRAATADKPKATRKPRTKKTEQ